MVLFWESEVQFLERTVLS